MTLHACRRIFTKAALRPHSKLLYFLGREIFMAHRDDVVLDVNEKPKTGQWIGRKALQPHARHPAAQP